MFGLKPHKHDAPLEVIFGMGFAIVFDALGVPKLHKTYICWVGTLIFIIIRYHNGWTEPKNDDIMTKLANMEKRMDAMEGKVDLIVENMT